VSELACNPALVEAARQAAIDHLPAPWPQDLPWPAAVPYRAPRIHTGAVASADVWTQSPTRLDLLHGRHGSLCEDDVFWGTLKCDEAFYQLSIDYTRTRLHRPSPMRRWPG
jgi:hypothetical protein